MLEDYLPPLDSIKLFSTQLYRLYPKFSQIHFVSLKAKMVSCPVYLLISINMENMWMMFIPVIWENSSWVSVLWEENFWKWQEGLLQQLVWPRRGQSNTRAESRLMWLLLALLLPLAGLSSAMILEFQVLLILWDCGLHCFPAFMFFRSYY